MNICQNHGDVIELNYCVQDMQFHTGLGGRALKVSSAMPKKAWTGG